MAMSKKKPIDYLSEESLEALETSLGAIYLVHKLEQHKKFNEMHSRLLRQFHECNALIGSKKEEVSSLENRTFINKMLRGNTVHERIQELESEISKLAVQAKGYFEEEKSVHDVMIELESEINDFKKVVRMHGVKPQAVVDEYNRIKARFLGKSEFGGEGEQQPNM